MFDYVGKLLLLTISIYALGCDSRPSQVDKQRSADFVKRVHDFDLELADIGAQLARDVLDATEDELTLENRIDEKLAVVRKRVEKEQGEVRQFDIPPVAGMEELVATYLDYLQLQLNSLNLMKQSLNSAVREPNSSPQRRAELVLTSTKPMYEEILANLTLLGQHKQTVIQAIRSTSY